MTVASQVEEHEHRLQDVEKRLEALQKAKAKPKMKRPGSERTSSMKRPGCKTPVRKEKNKSKSRKK